MTFSGSPSSPRRSTRVSILVVDDDRVVGRSLCRALAALDANFEVELALSGEAALAALSSTPKDVVITDLEMGRVGGRELLEELARDQPHTLRIVHSSQNESALGEDLRQLAHASFDKPAQPAAIAAVIARELERRG